MNVTGSYAEDEPEILPIDSNSPSKYTMWFLFYFEHENYGNVTLGEFVFTNSCASPQNGLLY